MHETPYYLFPLHKKVAKHRKVIYIARTLSLEFEIFIISLPVFDVRTEYNLNTNNQILIDFEL